MTGFPQRRLRRMRRTAAIRSLVSETQVTAADLISPLFVVESPDAAGPISSMPGVARWTVDQLEPEIEQLVGLGIRAVLLFGIPVRKDATGSAAWSADGVVPNAIRHIKDATDQLCIFTDVCLCSYTDHGHCGPVRSETAAAAAAAVANAPTVANDETLESLRKVACCHADAGADLVAPSGMMDGMVGAIRSALDATDHPDAGILSYSAKYASSFYGPFRDAADSTPAQGDRRGYQMNPANVREAVAEARLDVGEGADMIMVKPALPYLDVVRCLRDDQPEVPLAAYQVSGEYCMIKAAANNGWIDEERAMMESLVCIKRAGADAIITYFAKDAAKLLGR